MLFAFLVLFQKVPKVKNIKNPGFDNELLKETTCYLRNGEGMVYYLRNREHSWWFY